MVRTSFMLVVVTFVFSLLNFFIYYYFVSELFFLEKWNNLLMFCAVVITLFEITYFTVFKNTKINSKVIVFLASLIGITFIFFSMAVFYKVVSIILSLVLHDELSSIFAKNILDLIFAILTIFYALFGFVNGAAKANISKQKIKINNLKNPLNVVQLSDLHVGKIIKRKFVEDVVEKTNRLNPDIVVITGDLVDIEISQVMEFLLPLKELNSKFGVYYVLGNHEYFHGAHEIVKFIKTLNITVLQNDSVVIDDNINLIGLNDLFGNCVGYLKPDVAKAYEKVDSNLPNILLAHQPKQVKFINEKYRVDLMLSGHTHGGQIFPFNLFVMLDQPFVKGFNIYKNKIPVFVSKGTGCWGPPIRFLASSEIVQIKLERQ